jgi:ATP-dependent Clp protease adaptor protein ClpS
MRKNISNMSSINQDAGPQGDQEYEDSQGGLLLDTRTKADKPHLYRVVLHNDDYTPMDFVVEILRRFFSKSTQQATEIMLEVHHRGHAVCGIYPYEIAETKVTLVLETAKKNEYPLQCTMEKVP